MVSAISRAALFVALLAVVKGMGPLELDYGRTSRGHSSGAVLASKKVDGKAVDPQYLLQRFVDPLDYTLDLRPVFQTGDANFPQVFTAPGSVVINVNCTATSNYIQMHAHTSMNISSIKVETVTSTNIYSSHDREAENHYLNIRLNSYMAVGFLYKITIVFSSKIWDTKLDGLYYAKYNVKDETSETGVSTKELVSTQFEAIGAREVFPCFDQPDYKSNFRISLRHKPTFNAFSNGRLNSTSVPDNQGWVVSTFEETVKMPTYLIALIVSEHECVLADKAPAADFMTIDVGICGRAEAVNANATIGRNGAKKSANWSSQILKEIGNTFNFEYSNAVDSPKSKMHSVGIPDGYFGAGAMENWGLNTYRESYLMFFDGDSTESNKQQVLNILAHELAHQWFGNLVTCNWWQQIWLNEGFATIVSYDAMKRQFNKNGEFADMLDYMFYDANQGALMNDIDRDLPVINKAETVNEVDGVFGWPTYDKGGSLLRMMMSFMTETEFVKGVSSYLNRHRYESVQQDQFFDVMNNFAKGLPAGKTLKDIMDTYTLKPGYPLIQVKRRSPDSHAILISQEIYRDKTLAPPAHAGSYPNELWEVPLRIVTDNSTEAHPVFGSVQQQPNFWLDKNTIQVQYTNAPAAWTWAIVNPNGGGYFRVLYEDANIEHIRQQLIADPNKIPHLTRAHLLDDYFSFVTYGRHSNGLKMVKWLTDYMDSYAETNRVVWSTLFYNLNRYLSVLKFRSDADNADSDFDVFKNNLIPKIDRASTSLQCNVKGKTGSVGILCTQLLDWHSTLTNTQDDLRRTAVAEDLIDDDATKRLTPDQRQVYYCPAVRGDNDPATNLTYLIYDELSWRFADEEDKLYTKTVPALEYTRLFNGLACVEDPVLLAHLIDRTLSTDEVDNRFRMNRVALLQRIATRSTVGRDFLWQWIDGDAEGIVQTFGQTEIRSVLATIVGTMSEEEDIITVEKFNDDHRAFIGQDISIAAIRSNIEWYNKYGKQLKAAWSP